MGNEIQMRPSNDLSLFGGQAMADMVAKAEVMIKSGFLPKAYTKPESVIMACTIGAELGFSPMQSLNVINVIEGRPTLSVNACLALVQKSGGFVETLDLTDTLCRIRVSRPGRPDHTEEYTLVDASKAGLTGKQNWVKMPKNMLYARAASNGIRRVYADVLSGLYTTEEMQDATNQPVTDSVPEIKQPRAKAVIKVVEPEAAKPEVVIDAVLVSEEMGRSTSEPPLPVGNSNNGDCEYKGGINLELPEHINYIRAINDAFEPTDYDRARKLGVLLIKYGVTELEQVAEALKKRWERISSSEV